MYTMYLDHTRGQLPCLTSITSSQTCWLPPSCHPSFYSLLSLTSTFCWNFDWSSHSDLVQIFCRQPQPWVTMATVSSWIREPGQVHYFHSPPVRPCFLPHPHCKLWVFLLFEVTQFVISCYRSSGKLPHGRCYLFFSPWPRTNPTESWLLHTFLTVMYTKNKILRFPEKSLDRQILVLAVGSHWAYQYGQK